MATVRMSDKLLDEIFYSAIDVAKNTMPKPVELDMDVWANRVLSAFNQLEGVKKYLEAVEHLPDSMKKQALGQVDSLSQLSLGDKATYLSCSLPNGTTVPKWATSYSGLRIKLLPHEAGELLPALYQEYEDWNTNRQEYESQCREWANNVRTACRKFNTLNQALKHIPHLSKLVGPSYMAKVEKKASPRVKQAPVMDEIDTSDVGAKIAQATLMGKLR